MRMFKAARNNPPAGALWRRLGLTPSGGSTVGALEISEHHRDGYHHHDLLGTINNLGHARADRRGTARTELLNIGNSVTLTGGGTVLLDTIAANGASVYVEGNNHTLTNTNNKIVLPGHRQRHLC